MALRDYSDDDDYYTQDFRKDGVISVWLGLTDGESNADMDVLQDLCGVGYYALDDQEANNFDFELVNVERLMADLSYSKSFIADVVEQAKAIGIERARWAIVQYDFAYSPERVKRPIEADPLFLGVFEYKIE